MRFFLFFSVSSSSHCVRHNIKDRRMNTNEIDKLSLVKAHALFDTGDISCIEIGTVKGLCDIHCYLFDGLYEFAGKVRILNIAKGNFRFANCMYLDVILPVIEKMPETTFDEPDIKNSPLWTSSDRISFYPELKQPVINNISIKSLTHHSFTGKPFQGRLYGTG